MIANIDEEMRKEQVSTQRWRLTFQVEKNNFVVTYADNLVLLAKSKEETEEKKIKQIFKKEVATKHRKI